MKDREEVKTSLGDDDSDMSGFEDSVATTSVETDDHGFDDKSRPPNSPAVNGNSDSGNYPTATEPMIEDFAQNPMMDRVQLALREQLMRTHERVKRELLEQEEILRAAKKRREDVGVELYGMQHQLARLQRGLEAAEQRHEAVAEIRTESEGEIEELRKVLVEKRKKVEEVRKSVVISEAELDDVLEKVRQARKYNDEMKGEVAVTRRAAYKAEENVKDLEKDKKAQDVFIDGLHDQVKRLRADVSLADDRLKEQRKQTEEAEAMLREMGTEFETLVFEKKQLVQQWKSSLVALNRRDQALAAASTALSDAQAASKDHRSELQGLKRDIAKARADKDDLTLSRDKLEGEAQFLEAEMTKIRSEQEAASQHFEMLQKTIAHTTEAEAKVESDMKKVKKEISTVNHKIELITRERQSYEDQIGTFKHEQTTMSKATVSLAKEEKALLIKIHEKEIEAANIQNELARLKIDAVNTDAHSSQLREILDAETAELAKKDEEIERIEKDIRKRNDEIEKKMNRVDQLNRKYEKMFDGIEEPEPLGPLEATIKSLGQDIETEDKESQRLQRQWLADQTTLVQTISDTDEMQEKNTEVNARLNILKQKRLRLIQEIHVNEAEVKAVQTSMEGMHSDMSRLNELISKNNQLQTEIANGNNIKEKEFMHELKELEKESVQMETRIADIKAAKKQILDEVVEVERQILLWEKKIQLEKETQAALHNSDEAKDIKGMEKEIHRMRHRLESLKRDQEKMIREMEYAIHKREDIAVKFKNTKGSSAGASRGKGKTLTMAELKKAGAKLRSQLKEASKDAEEFKGQIETARSRLENVRVALTKANTDYDNVQILSKELQTEINGKIFEKQRLLGQLDRQDEMVQKFSALDNGETEAVDPRKDQFTVEKRLTVALGKMKRIQNVIAGLRMKHSQFDEVFERVGLLAADIVTD